MRNARHHPLRPSLINRISVAVGVLVATPAGCSTSGPSRDTALKGFEQPAPGELGAQVAAYELVTGGPQRVSVGLVRGGSELIGCGSVIAAMQQLLASRIAG